MKNILSYVALSTMAVSAIVATPTVTSANETVANIPAMGLYDVETMTYYSFSDFSKLSRSEKVSLFKRNFYIVADSQGNTVTKLDVLTLSNQGLEKAKTSYSERTGVQWEDYASVAKANITAISNGKVTIEGKEYSVAANLQGLLNDSNAAVLKDAKVSFKAENNTITNLKYLEITNSGTTNPQEFAGNLVLDGKGATVDGDVIVNGSYISLKNLTINGDLESGASFKDGLYTLSIDVKGKTILRDAADTGLVGSLANANMKTFVTLAAISETATSRSLVVFEDSSLGDTEVSRPETNLGIRGQSTVRGLTISSNATITAPSTVMIPKVTILDGAENVELNANVGEVKVDSKGEVSLSGQGKITTLTATNKEAKFNVGENTKITNLQLPEGVKLSDVISNYDQVKGNIEKVDGQPTPSTPPSTGGGGGSTPSPAPGSGGGSGSSGNGGSSGGGGGSSGDDIPVVDRTAPELETVTLTIGNKSVATTRDLNGNFSVSLALADLTDKDMFTEIHLQASEQITGTLTFSLVPSQEEDILTDETGVASPLIVSEILGKEKDPQQDGVSVSTLKTYIMKLHSINMNIELVDSAENKKTITVTILQ